MRSSLDSRHGNGYTQLALCLANHGEIWAIKSRGGGSSPALHGCVTDSARPSDGLSRRVYQNRSGQHELVHGPEFLSLTAPLESELPARVPKDFCQIRHTGDAIAAVT
jgi:hypothetical protein